MLISLQYLCIAINVIAYTIFLALVIHSKKNLKQLFEQLIAALCLSLLLILEVFFFAFAIFYSSSQEIIYYINLPLSLLLSDKNLAIFLVPLHLLIYFFIIIKLKSTAE